MSSIASIRTRATEGPYQGVIHAQVESVLRRESSSGKPFFELRLRDAGDSLVLRAWSESPAFAACGELDPGAGVEVEGEFYFNGAFGLDARRWSLRRLNDVEEEALFAGSPGQVAATSLRMSELTAMLASVQDPRLRVLCELFIRDFGSRFSRSAAARMNHHARKGGLLEHTLQMMRSASAICGVYPALNRDLMLAGVLFHDSGKLWETCPPERGFGIPREPIGELLGHITTGIELVNGLWKQLPLDQWKSMQPASDEVRLHLLHLIASHHGSLEFGSPVEPKTPEAIALHYIDNLDARLEMFAEAFDANVEVAPRIFERSRPLGVYPVRPLPEWVSPG
ncbi:MAG: HD domain-containing protein [Terrimicrobiaceae bacterium]